MPTHIPVSPIAQTIADQIGRSAFFMMGTKYKYADGDDLIFDIKGCAKFNKIQIHLAPSDTYTITFKKVRQGTAIRSEEATGVYFDSLHDVIEHRTGLTLRMPTIRYARPSPATPPRA